VADIFGVDDFALDDRSWLHGSAPILPCLDFPTWMKIR